MKRWLKRNLPARTSFLANGRFGLFGRLLHDPNLWHLNRYSVSGAVAIGLFVAFMPPLGQSLLAAALAIWLRVNLPIAALTTFVTNPLTIPPVFYFAYRVGCWLLVITPERFDLDFWLDPLQWTAVVWPMTVGCLICGALAAGLGYATIQTFWRWRILRQIERRRARYRATTSGASRPSSRRQT